MKNYLIYLAGPISGLSYKECTEWRQYITDNLHDSIQALSPLRKKPYLKNQEKISMSYENWPLSASRGIYARDKFDCHRSDLVFVNLLNAKTVSIGTVMEISWAAQANIPIILIMEPNNIHAHPMLKEACPFIVDKLNEGISLIHSLLLPMNNDD